MMEQDEYTPVGTFVITDKTGKTIAEGHNRIVNTGRSVLAKVFCSGMRFSGGELISSVSSSYKFTNIKFGSSTDATTADHAIPTASIISDLTIPVTSSVAAFNESSRSITFTMSLVGKTQSYVITEACLCYSDTAASSTESLFSRFTFDPVYLNSGDYDTITYIIRF
jgi:hypothetical protein